MQAFNPYLPEWEYIPDGEPYVFGDRVYVYGSHDKFNGFLFCLKDYVCWSAPVNDLSHWTCSGVIYKKNQDPMNRLGLRILFAPDAAKGPDGRYYLYYAFDFLGVMGVAVCDTPDGQYQFYGHVHYPDGTVWGRKKGDEFPFDPGVLVDDDGRVWLYSGFETPIPAALSRFRGHKNTGGVVMELEQDMATIKDGPKVIFPTRFHHPPADFKGHEFFEASSIRKIDGKYVFVYSSTNNHELCYAASDRPDGGFRFGGTLVDQGDLYLRGNSDESRAANYLGNTHGGMVEGGWGIAVLSNKSEEDAELVQWICYNFALGLPLEQELYWCRPCGRAFSAPEMIIGDYVGHEGLVAHALVYEKNGQLYVRAYGEERILKYCEDTVFAAYDEKSGERVNTYRFFIRDGRAWGVKAGTRVFLRA